MAYSLEDKLVVAITSRALFDLDEAHGIYEKEGLERYRAYMLKNEEVPLEPGTGFPLVRGLLAINGRADESLVEVVLVSRNDADSGFRIFNSIEHHDLDISRAAFTDGRNPYVYLEPFYCDLFLSANDDDVRAALQAGIAAALAYPPPDTVEGGTEQVRIAFDGDAVLFSDESERVFQAEGLEGFQEREARLEDTPLNPGPFKGFVQALSRIQKKFPEEQSPIRTALVTARGAPAHRRAVKTLRSWEIRLDEYFFLGGVEKTRVLRAFQPHIFFDDQKVHIEPAASSTPSARVLPGARPSRPRRRKK